MSDPLTKKERIDLILRAAEGDRAAWERIRLGESGFFVPLADLDETAQSKVKAFFSNRDIDAALDNVDPRWAQEHPEQMANMRLLANRFDTDEKK